MDSIAEEFKAKSSSLIEDCLECLKNYGGELPISMGMINMGKSMFYDPLEGETLIRTFVEDSSHTWDAVRERDVELLASVCNEEAQERAPMFASMVGKIIDFLLKNRRELCSEEFEEHVWSEVEELIKMSIQYVHLKRNPKKKPDGTVGYTSMFIKGFSVKEQAHRWNLDL